MKTKTNNVCRQDNWDFLELAPEFNHNEKEFFRQYGQIYVYRSGEKINLGQSKYDTTIWWVLSGSVLLEDPCRNGKIIFTYLKDGMYLPADLEVASRQTLLTIAHICQEVTLLELQLQRFDYLKQTNNHFIGLVHQSLVKKYLLQKLILQICAEGKIADRIKNILIFFARECGSHLQNGDIALSNALTYRTIASFANTSQTTVCQSIKQYREKGLLSKKSRKLIIRHQAMEMLLELS